jgi:hypothetical protein
LSGALGEDAGKEMKKLIDEMDQLFDARIADAVFQRLPARELPLEAEDIPGVRDGAAMNGAVQQVLGRGQILCRFFQLPLAGQELSGRQQNVHFRDQANRRDIQIGDLSPRRGRIAHVGEQQGQATALQLPGLLFRQVMIDVLPSASERLTRDPGFIAQALAM